MSALVIEQKPNTSLYIKRGGDPLQAGQQVMVKSWTLTLPAEAENSLVKGGYDRIWYCQTPINTWIPIIEPFNDDGSLSKRYR